MRVHFSIVQLVAMVFALQPIAAVSLASAHSPPPPDVGEIAISAEELQERLSRIRRLDLHNLNAGLSERAIFKMQQGGLDAGGAPPATRSQVLFDGPRRAFPHTAKPSLSSTGTRRTLTVLVDFKNYDENANNR